MSVELEIPSLILKVRQALPNLGPAEKREVLSILDSLSRGDDGWPLVFVNRDTNKLYTPHHDAERDFVMDDGTWRYGAAFGGEGGGKSVAGIIKTLRRLRAGCDGMMACVGPETMIEGVPIAERHKSFLVQTLFGSAWASPGILEGKADLFRVTTQSGESILVTRNHRFLTLIGWRRLEDLCVGDVIAADDTWRAHSSKGKVPSSQCCCFRCSHPCDGLASPWEYHIRDRMRLSALPNDYGLDCANSPCHACIDSSLAHTPQFSSVVECQQLCGDGGSGCMICGASLEGLRTASRSGSLGTSVWCPCLRHVDSVSEMGSAHALSVFCGHCSRSNQLPQQSLSTPCQHRTSLEFVGLSDLPYSNYTMKVRWAQIESVAFSHYGEFYDLAVPGPQHYSAHGLLNHNSPNLPHFQRSLWKEFQRWCPWDCVIPSHQRMADKSWMPVKPFDIVFSRHNNYLHCVGAKDVSSLEGPNLNFVHFDEARHFRDASAIKVLDGRIRIDGPDGSRPQMWFTTTRMMNWLFDYFGPLVCECPEHGEIINQQLMIKGIEVQTGEELVCPTCGGPVTITDEYAGFKLDSTIISLPTIGNAANLTNDFVAKRGQTLTEMEASVLILDQWGEIQEGQPFLPTMSWWDTLEESLPPLSRSEPLVLTLDAATGRQWGSSDCFALLGVTRHPDPKRADENVAVRIIHTWQAPARGKIDFRGTAESPGPERVLLNLCGWDIGDTGNIVYRGNGYRVIVVVYDPDQLHDMAMRLGHMGVAWFKEFSQSGLRYESDRQLLNLIQRGNIAHDGNIELRMNLKNADRKLDSTGHKLRIVKRSKSRRVDLAVCLSMGAHECLRLNL